MQVITCHKIIRLTVWCFCFPGPLSKVCWGVSCNNMTVLALFPVDMINFLGRRTVCDCEVVISNENVAFRQKVKVKLFYLYFGIS